jgi:peptidoglycan/LPS O-acetylase OafA/YrhL
VESTEVARVESRVEGRLEGNSRPRVAELDALRGLAALGVVLFHYTTFYQQEQGHLQPLGFGFPAGNYGVHLFFLISGFVIFMTLERTRTAMDFVVSRVSRLFPAYWMAMALTAAVVYTIGLPQQRIAGGDLFANLTMLQEVLGFEHLDGSYWTLQVELFFYVQMLFWFVLGQLRHIVWIILAWLVLAVVYAWTEQHHVHFSYTVREVLLLRHIPFFALDIVFYRIHTRAGRLPGNLALVALSLLAIALSKPHVYLFAALACCAIFGLFVAGALRWLCAAPFVFFGGISYSLYLLHQAIGFALIHRLEAAGVHSLFAVALTTLAALLLATALTRFVERPAMRVLRESWRRRRA